MKSLEKKKSNDKPGANVGDGLDVDVPMKDLGIKTALVGTFGTTFWGDSADVTVEQIVKYSSAIVATPGRKLWRIVRKLRGIDDSHTKDIEEILLSKDITNQEKLELVRLKIEHILKHLKGNQRTTFLLTVIALLVFIFGQGTPAFPYFLVSLREFLGGKDDEDTIREYLIDIYREYNAPLPDEL